MMNNSDFFARIHSEMTQKKKTEKDTHNWWAWTNNLISLDNIYDAMQLKEKLVHKMCCQCKCFKSLFLPPSNGDKIQYACVT